MRPMDIVVTMSNGTKVAMDGEAMTMDGEMTTMEDMKGNMENKTDDR